MAVFAGLDRLPEPLQEDEVALDVLGGRALRGGADDDAALLDVQALDHVLEAVALGIVEPARDAEALALGDEDEEAAGERDLGRQPRAFVFIGSLTAWTRICWPQAIRSVIFLPCRLPSSSGTTISST